METIIGRNGTQTLVIKDLTVSRQHCKVTDNGDGSFTVENLSKSGTKIDGRPIIRATATGDSILTLGPTFSASLKELLKGSKQNSSGQNETPVYSISHLRSVWDNFNKKNIEAAEKQRKINLTRTGLGVFTMCAMPMIFFLGPIGYVLTAIGVAGNIYSFVGMKNSETHQQRQQRQDDFDDAWICPNPNCRRTLPARNYKMLVRNHKNCPYCKCKYVEK